jgi:hypothetical protein
VNRAHDIELEADEWAELEAWREESEREAMQYEQELKANHFIVDHSSNFSDLPF